MQRSSQLRYVDADEVGSEVVDFDDLKVRTPDGDKLGEVDGFIVDSDARRAYYVVVDSGGWFTSRKFLVPIGHARIDEDGDALVVDITRDTISRYPQFDRESFERLGDSELRQYEREYGEACCPDETASGDWSYDSHQHYRQPMWWRTEYYNWDVPAAVGTAGSVASPGNRRTALDDALPGDIDNDEPETHRAIGSPTSRRTALDDVLPGDIDNDEPDAHRGVGPTNRRTALDDVLPGDIDNDEPEKHRSRDIPARDRVDGGDVSPHLGKRAQPGDVLGIETGGETTSVGDTDEDEDKRRRDAERESSKDRRKD